MSKKTMKEQFALYGIELSEKQENQFNRYYELLIEWNQKINLTAITEYDMVVNKHFIDSALLLTSPVFTETKHNSVLDLGTGAGFPGIVLAILRPQDSFTLIDSLNKRIDFINLVVQELQLPHVYTFHGRAEDFGQNSEFRNQFDFVVSRAVAELPVLLEYCIPFVKPDGYFVSYKGPKYKEEIELSQNALDILGSTVEKIDEIDISSQEKRYLIFVKNNKLTSSKYPRRAGMPKKKPL